jgi:hypothetical protein
MDELLNNVSELRKLIEEIRDLHQHQTELLEKYLESPMLWRAKPTLKSVIGYEKDMNFTALPSEYSYH